MPDLYPLGETLFRAGFRLLDLDVRSFGHEHIPVSGPAILASNHVSYLDFCFVALAMPPPRRRVRFVARREVFTHPVAGPLMRGLRQIEADPHGDREQALSQAVEMLREGEVVGIHPEGTISPSFEPREGKTGAVRMARLTGAPIVPVAVWGGQRLITKWRPRNLERGVTVDVHYGRPYHPGPDVVQATEELMATITGMVNRAWETYPDVPASPDDRWWLPACRGGTAPTPEEAERRLEEQHAERRRRRQAELRDDGDDD